MLSRCTTGNCFQGLRPTHWVALVALEALFPLLVSCTTDPCLEAMQSQARHGGVPDCVYFLADPGLSDWQLQQRKRAAERCKQDRQCIPKRAVVRPSDNGEWHIAY